MFIYNFVVFWFYQCFDSPHTNCSSSKIREHSSYRFDFQPEQGAGEDVCVTMKSDTKSRCLQSMDLYLSIENECITLQIIPWKKNSFTQEAANWNIDAKAMLSFQNTVIKGLHDSD